MGGRILFILPHSTWSLFSRDPLFILNWEGRIVAIFVGTPEDPDWPAVIVEMVKIFTQARQDACDIAALSAEASLHCCSNYYQFTEGASLGGGQRVGPRLFS